MLSSFLCFLLMPIGSIWFSFRLRISPKKPHSLDLGWNTGFPNREVWTIRELLDEVKLNPLWNFNSFFRTHGHVNCCFSRPWVSYPKRRSHYLSPNLRPLTHSANPSTRVAISTRFLCRDRVRIPARFNQGRWNLWRTGSVRAVPLQISHSGKIAKFAI